MGAKVLTDDNFEQEVLKSDKPVLVDFWAEWCGPCKAFLPVLEEFAGEQEASVTVGKVNVEENPLTPTTYGIRALPTIALFKDGKVVAQQAGSMPKDALAKWVAENS